MSVITDYTKAAEELPAEYFLGRLVMFTISQADVELEQARQDMDDLGLQTNTLRKRLRHIDAFKKATNEVSVKFTRPNGSHHAFLVRRVGRDDADSARRHIVLERAIHEQGKRRHLVYDEVAEIIYDRGVRQKDGSIADDSITVAVRDLTVTAGYDLSEEERAWLEQHVGYAVDGREIGDNLRSRFDYLRTHMDSHAVRTAVRDYIVDNLAGILVKENGGLYFVAEKHADELTKLKQWVADVGSKMHTVPLLNILDQREMLIDAYENEMLDRVTSLTAEIDKILADGNRTITQDTFDEYVLQTSLLLAQTDDYADLLDNKLDTARVTLDSFKFKALSLASRVKVPKKMRK